MVAQRAALSASLRGYSREIVIRAPRLGHPARASVHFRERGRLRPSDSLFFVVTIDWVRTHCLGLPHVTEDVKWEDDLVFSIGGKMFAVVNLEPGATWLSFKCTAEEFAELSERPGCRAAPYLARANWVALDHPDALASREVARLLTRAYELVFSKLSKKMQRRLVQ